VEELPVTAGDTEHEQLLALRAGRMAVEDLHYLLARMRESDVRWDLVEAIERGDFKA
jgi:hypothetical protein